MEILLVVALVAITVTVALRFGAVDLNTPSCSQDEDGGGVILPSSEKTQ